MINILKVDIVDVYNVEIRGLSSKHKPMAKVGPLGIPYTYITAILGYHIVQSLIQEPDDDTRLSEVAYNNVLAGLGNNLLIRYQLAVKGLRLALGHGGQIPSYNIEPDGIITLSIYEPTLKLLESEHKITRDKVINRILSNVVTSVYGQVVGVDDSDRYNYYRKQLVAKNKLKLSSVLCRGVTISLEKFVDSQSFVTWYNTNTGNNPTEEIRFDYLARLRTSLKNATIGSENELYTLVIDTICTVFYQKTAIRRFINDIRIVMADGDLTPFEAIGVVSDRLIIAFYCEMLEV